jgi:Ca-activated chloride channel family protein
VFRNRFLTGAAGAVLLLAGVIGASRAPGAAAAEAAPTPGQLAIQDKKGQTVGLCPLKHTDVTADVSGFVARVNVRQEFQNPSKEPVEAVYTFPLPDDAAVDDMTMTIGERVVKGQVKRREEARQIYEAAKAAGQSAALLDQERPNIFTQSVANLMPGTKVTIAISYVNLLKYDEGKYEFSFPMVVGPRYTPGGGYTTPGKRGEPSPDPGLEAAPGTKATVTDADKITPPITPPETRAGHDISLKVNLDAGLPLQEIKSQLHEVRIDKTGANSATVRLQDEQTIPNKDFILRYTVAGDQLRTGLLAHAPGGGGGYFTLILQPPAAPPQKEVSPKEMVFVIDQTGSQQGLPIQKAKETMRFCIENLNAGDTFQLLAFNTAVFPCFSAPVPVTPENVDQALKFLEPLQGNGGTDILKAVDYVLKVPADPARARIVCYMTDGYVGNDMQILDYIRKNRGNTRMFPFGVGNSVNRFLIDQMAKEGRGAPFYVTLNTPGEQAASKFYARVAKPLLLDPSVEWNGLPVEDVYPKQVPDVFTAGPIILKGRYKKAAEGDVTVRGLLRGQPWSQTVHVSLPAVEKDGAALPTVWARERIEDLQAQDYLGAQSGKPDPKIKEQIVNLALDYRLMSQYTSFVAVEEKVVNIGGKQRRVDVPVEMPEGVSYNGIFGEQLQEREALGLNGLARQARGRTLFSNGHSFGRAAPAPQGGRGGLAAGAAPALTPAPKPAAKAPAAPPGPAGITGPAGPQGLRRLGKDARAEREKVADAEPAQEYGEILDGTEAGRKRLAAMKPEERRALLSEVKLAPGLAGLAEKVKKEGKGGTLHKEGLPEVDRGRVEIQVWLNELPPDGLKRLKALGFDLAATLRPNQLLLGTLPVDRLEALIELPFVRRVEPPRFK